MSPRFNLPRPPFMLAVAALLLTAGVPVLGQERVFTLETATVESINAAFDSGLLTSEALVQLYLARIEAYENHGPNINAFINIHPDPLGVARALDAERRATGPRSPLHGIPVVLKDNFNTSDLPTTGGSIGLKDLRPAREAFVVERLRAAGAIVLGKTNLTELVAGALDSPLGGRTSNPWDLTRTPGQSSAGSGAALAANFAPLAFGTDNGQSIRSPASASGIVGIKNTVGLISCAGVIPSSLSHNSCGPMTRNVADMAHLLDAVAAFDPRDFMTRFALGQIPDTYTSFLDADALQGARLGVVTELQGDGPEHAEVNRVFDEAVARMASLGATVIPVRIPNMDEYRDVGTDIYEAWDLFDAWFGELGPEAEFHDFQSFLDHGTYGPELLPRTHTRREHAGAEYLPEYERNLLKMHEFRRLVVDFMDEHDLDALAYPMQQILVAPHGEPNAGRNGFLASMAMLPAIDVPAGYSQPNASAPDGVPVGMDLLGRPFDEGRLLALAFAWEQRGLERRWPSITRPLSGEEVSP
ncbi:MAG: amidase [Gemmatimonadales bacterium]|nr:MAG: amidase [Gemmatimonadales bacterium]